MSIDSSASNGRDRRSLIGALLDHQGLYSRLTGRENLAYFGELQGLSGSALGRRVTELVSALGLDELADRRVEGFSRGERLKVALGRALVHAPQHLVLDEPLIFWTITAILAVVAVALASAGTRAGGAARAPA